MQNVTKPSLRSPHHIDIMASKVEHGTSEIVMHLVEQFKSALIVSV